MTDNSALTVRALELSFGAAKILHGLDLHIPSGSLSIVGRNGMGKTTLCRAIVGLLQANSGDIEIFGHNTAGLAPFEVSRLGLGYVPQGRLIWPSLSVHEHLQLAFRQQKSDAVWSIERIYSLFPRLAQRRNNGGAQLSGGEQQMLAIGRALLTQPRLLVLDEPTEGLAPVIVDHVVDTLVQISRDEAMSILLVEQNLSVACRVSEQVAVMVNGNISQTIAARDLASDKAIQQQVLGIGG